MVRRTHANCSRTVDVRVTATISKRWMNVKVSAEEPSLSSLVRHRFDSLIPFSENEFSLIDQ